MAKTNPSWAQVTGPLVQYADGLRAELFRLGCTPLTAACHIRRPAHLSRWLTAEGPAAQDLDMLAAERYFAARRSAAYAKERTTEALGPLLGYLRGLRAAPLPPAEPATETSLLLDRFAVYMASERGRASSRPGLPAQRLQRRLRQPVRRRGPGGIPGVRLHLGGLVLDLRPPRRQLLPQPPDLRLLRRDQLVPLGQQPPQPRIRGARQKNHLERRAAQARAAPHHHAPSPANRRTSNTPETTRISRHREEGSRRPV